MCVCVCVCVCYEYHILLFCRVRYRVFDALSCYLSLLSILIQNWIKKNNIQVVDLFFGGGGGGGATVAPPFKFATVLGEDGIMCKEACVEMEHQ